MAYQVEVVETGIVFQVEPEETLLNAATRQGVRIYSDCQFGGCGTCRIKVVEGAVNYEDEFLPMSLSEEEHAEGFAAACQAMLHQNIKVSLANHIDELPPPQEITLQVEAVRELCKGVRELSLSGTALSEIDYLPGQYLNIHLDDGRVRSFSMANAKATDGKLILHIREINGGRFTQYELPHLTAGQNLKVTVPVGTFHYHERDWRQMIFIATGTGIAPLRAILESLLDNDDCPPIHVYWGMRNEADLYQNDEFLQWADRLTEFQFTPVLSNPSPNWQGKVGYVQDAVCADYVDLTEHALYLCGAPVMIQDAHAKLTAQGADEDFIYADAFNFQHELTEQKDAVETQ